MPRVTVLAKGTTPDTSAIIAVGVDPVTVALEFDENEVYGADRINIELPIKLGSDGSDHTVDTLSHTKRFTVLYAPGSYTLTRRAGLTAAVGAYIETV